MNMGHLCHRIQIQIGVEPEIDRQRETLLLGGEESSNPLLSIILIVYFLNSRVLSFAIRTLNIRIILPWSMQLFEVLLLDMI